jgi:hypothetical protein
MLFPSGRTSFSTAKNFVQIFDRLSKFLVGKLNYTHSIINSMTKQKRYLFVGIMSIFIFGNLNNSFAQESLSSDQIISIYLGEKIPNSLLMDMSRNNLTIEIRDNEMNLEASLTEQNVSEFTFATPGFYSILFHSDHETSSSDHECNHEDHEKLVEVEVLPYRIVFVLENLSFSTEIIGGKEMAGETLIVPVEYSSFTNSPMEIASLKMISAGVNTTIQGTLKDAHITLSPGMNQLTYSLKGSASKNTYIMLDFYDLIGRTQSFALPTQIK